MGNQRGFTLIELMITLIIVAILAGWAVPAMRSFILNNRMVSTNNDFVAEMVLARSEAIKRNNSVTICKSSDGATCNTSGADWSSGWIVFEDDGGDAQVTSSADKLLRASDAPPLTMTAGSRIADAIIFSKFGLASFRPDTSGTDPDDRQFRLYDSRGCSAAIGRTIEISSTGHARIIHGC